MNKKDNSFKNFNQITNENSEQQISKLRIWNIKSRYQQYKQQKLGIQEEKQRNSDISKTDIENDPKMLSRSKDKFQKYIQAKKEGAKRFRNRMLMRMTESKVKYYFYSYYYPVYGVLSGFSILFLYKSQSKIHWKVLPFASTLISGGLIWYQFHTRIETIKQTGAISQK